MNDGEHESEIDLHTERDVEKLRAEALSLRARLELRAVEASVLRIALDTIGKCAMAQGRRLTIGVVAVIDDPMGGASATSFLVADAGGDEEAIGKAIARTIEPLLTELVEARMVSADAVNLLDVMADLDEAGVLESTYNIDPQAMHDDVECDSIPPFEAALYAWRNAGHPVYADDALPNGSTVIGQSGRRYVVEGDIDSVPVPVEPGPVPIVPGLRPIPGGKDRKR